MGLVFSDFEYYFEYYFLNITLNITFLILNITQKALGNDFVLLVISSCTLILHKSAEKPTVL